MAFRNLLVLDSGKEINIKEIKTEVIRKSIHISFCLIPILYNTIGDFYTFLVLYSGLALYLLSEFCRIKNIKLMKLFQTITNLSRRKTEINSKITFGPVNLVIGISLAMMFTSPYREFGIYVLTLSDGMASLVGKSIGRIKIEQSNKTIEGSLAFFTVTVLLAANVTKNPVLAIALSLFLTILEYISKGDLDNLLLPIFASSLVFSGDLIQLMHKLDFINL